ncbi:retropepsin-like aspartic protease, partial [Salmonella enterica]|uniref:retropepsin-like aspartic protease n=1 Tax=Salmonella enterica TaxID=28901 RepID=UPI00325FD475
MAKHRIPCMKLSRPIPVLNVDGTSNVNGTITHYTWRSFTLGQKRLTARLLITSLGKEDVILGLPWLQKHNPNIDWKART